jgi:flagellar hook assembly protein FlgD
LAIGKTQVSGITSTQIETLLTTQLAAFKAASITSVQFGALYVTPVVLDLNGDGIQTTSIQNGVSFDINNDGKVDQTAWVARGDGLLVRDINKDGQINNGSELFGSATSLGNGKTAADGYVAMKALDTNNDGVLDASDAAFGELSVWTDNNGNGMTDGNELTKLSDLGINSLSLNATKSSVNNNGNLIGLMGSYTTTDGQMHTMGDVWFQTDASGNRVFDLAAIAKAAGISKVDMTNAQADQLNVTLADVLAVGTPDILSGTSQVTITGDSGVVNLTAGGSGWSLAGPQTDGADTYMVYVNQNAHLLVNDKIHRIIS